MPENADLTSSGKVLDFWIDSYKLRIDYITKQLDRMWNRFQLLLSIDIALAGLVFAPLSEKRLFGTSIFALLGVLVSLFWYLVGAEDRFLVQVYREQLRRDTDEVKKLLNLPHYIAVGDTEAPTRVTRDPVQFRFSAISITRLVVLFPMLFMVFFVVIAAILVR